MNEEEILRHIEGLSHSQGFYGRLLRDLLDARENDPESYYEYMGELLDQDFKELLDLVLYLEEG